MGNLSVLTFMWLLLLSMSWEVNSRSDCKINANGCSVPLGLPAPYKKTFTPACDKHDVCYYCVSLHATLRSLFFTIIQSVYNITTNICGLRIIKTRFQTEGTCPQSSPAHFKMLEHYLRILLLIKLQLILTFVLLNFENSARIVVMVYVCGQPFQGELYGWDQRQCDKAFKSDMYTLCEKNGKRWFSLGDLLNKKKRCKKLGADAYYTAVRSFGHLYWEKNPPSWCQAACAKNLGDPNRPLNM